MNGILEYYSCPPGYCRCNKVDGVSDVCSNVYYYDNDDLQCVCDRQGKNDATVFINVDRSFVYCIVQNLPGTKLSRFSLESQCLPINFKVFWCLETFSASVTWQYFNGVNGCLRLFFLTLRALLIEWSTGR